MRGLAGALLLAVLLGGCLGDLNGSVACPARNGGAFLAAPASPTVDPRTPSDLLYLVSGLNDTLGPTVLLNVTTVAGQAPIAADLAESGQGPQRLERVRVQPTAYASSGGLSVAFDVRDANLPPRCGRDGGIAFSAGGKEVQGQLMTPGRGAHVWYAGFWENGTLFETNIAALDQSHWPRAGWYGSIPYDPLPVYVYDQARSEEPAYWKPVPGAPGTGTPVDGPAATATSAPGLGYYSTIKGFNDGLKGLSTTSARVIHMNATDAYPTGTPNNPLAGDNLVFYVTLQDVVDCPMPRPDGQAPPSTLPCPAVP